MTLLIRTMHYEDQIPGVKGRLCHCYSTLNDNNSSVVQYGDQKSGDQGSQNKKIVHARLKIVILSKVVGMVIFIITTH